MSVVSVKASKHGVGFGEGTASAAGMSEIAASTRRVVCPLPGESIRPRAPLRFHGERGDWIHDGAIAVSPVHVRILANAVVDVSGAAMHAYDPRGRSLDFPDQPLVDFATVDPGRIRRIAGRVLVMVAPGANLFSHWLFDSLPKLEAVRLAGVAVHDFDAFQVNNRLARFTQEGLRRCGVGLDKVIGRDRHAKFLAADELLIVTDIRKGFATPRWVIEFTRRTFGVKSASPAAKRRIYISRAKARRRRVINEDEVGALLASFGFTTMFAEQVPIEEMARAISEAAYVVAPHGAGLANIVFASRGATVVEFYGWHVSPEYWLLAGQCGLRYVTIEAGGPDGRPRSALSREKRYDHSAINAADIAVDIAVLRKALVDLGLSAGAVPA